MREIKGMKFTGEFDCPMITIPTRSLSLTPDMTRLQAKNIAPPTYPIKIIFSPTILGAVHDQWPMFCSNQSSPIS